MAQTAAAHGFSVIEIETPERRSLPALLIPKIHAVLLTLDPSDPIIKKAYRALVNFFSAMCVKYKDIEFHFELEDKKKTVKKEMGVANSGDLEHDLMALFTVLGETLKAKKTALGLFIDEIQYIPEDQFAALIMTLHKCAQLNLPILLIGAGLPQVIGNAGRAKSYSERLFEYIHIGALDTIAAKQALEIPAKKLHVQFERDA